MARTSRKLTATERRLLERRIARSVPQGKRNATTHPVLWGHLEGYLRRGKIPAYIAVRVFRELRSRGVVRVSTRVGIWRPIPGEQPATGTAKGAREPVRTGARRIRKVVVYVCTRCYLAFPTKGGARTHWAEH